MKSLLLALSLVFVTDLALAVNPPSFENLYKSLPMNTVLAGTGKDYAASKSAVVPCEVSLVPFYQNRLSLGLIVKINGKQVRSLELFKVPSSYQSIAGHDPYEYNSNESYAECCHSGGSYNTTFKIEKKIVDGKAQYFFKGVNLLIREDEVRNGQVINDAIVEDDVECNLNNPVSVF